jgi:hypothetical protein
MKYRSKKRALICGTEGVDFFAHGNGCLSIKNGSWSAHVSTAERLSFGERKKKSNFRFADSVHIHSPSKKNQTLDLRHVYFF